ncbi:MAG: maleylpyruvate isomerase N-terminal domain-containing protein [Anaerolineales bacterium]|nr:maleylpyruvate isomerase N-terminal domain-containing protein [Anaerolineales bacterium]
MNVLDILKYGDLTLLGAVKGIPEDEWKTPDVCGWWSVKDIMAHMISFELLHADVLDTFLGAEPGAYMQGMAQGGEKFNQEQVTRRKDVPVSAVLEEYQESHTRVMVLARRIPDETYRQNGIIPWYGAEYCLDDFIVYSNYAHKREHSAQVNIFRDKLKQTGKV